MISILTVTKRTGWEEVAINSLNSQTYQDFEWVVVTETWPINLPKQLKNGQSVITLLAPPKKEGSHSNLSASNNEGLRYCSGEHVVFYQDFIELEPDCIEKLVSLVTPKTFVTTVTKNPSGDKEDPRYLGLDLARPCLPEEWEANVGIAPMAIIRELGGSDERLDQGWAWDNALLALKAEMLGCNFIIDETNRPQLLYHPKEPDIHPEMPMNGELCANILHNIRLGREPLNAGHL